MALLFYRRRIARVAGALQQEEQAHTGLVAIIKTGRRDQVS
jgi:hypothetical protein